MIHVHDSAAAAAAGGAGIARRPGRQGEGSLMLGYIIRRVLQAILIMIGVTLISFVLLRRSQGEGGEGDPRAREPNATGADRRVQHAERLDQPLVRRST